MTEFSSKCEILGELYAKYRDADEFKAFVAKNDLGLPLAHFISENLCQASSDGVRYITETFDLFLDSLQLFDTGFANLDAVFNATKGMYDDDD